MNEVPAAIPRARVLDLLGGLGIENPREVRWLTFDPDEFRVEVLAKDDSGCYYYQGDSLATHVLSIKVED